MVRIIKALSLEMANTSGRLGISGATPELDEICAKAAIDAVTSEL